MGGFQLHPVNHECCGIARLWGDFGEGMMLWGIARGVEWAEHYSPREFSDSSGSVLLGSVSAQ